MISSALILLLSLSVAAGQEPPSSPSSALADRDLENAQQQVTKIKGLIASGALPPAKLAEVEERLADAEDRDWLARTLYSSQPIEKTTGDEANRMCAAAERRVSREQKQVANLRQLLQSGIIARADVDKAELELSDRERVLSLAQNRRQLLKQLQQMAESEGAAERLRASPDLERALIRFNGSKQFAARDLQGIQAAFAAKFNRPLPISAQGQTAVHQALGLDHRGRVDVALAPASREGLWLRDYLEHHGIPYLAFRSAVTGAATAPHIHLGSGSPRLVPQPAAPVTMQ